MTSSTVEDDNNRSVGTEQHPRPPTPPPSFQGVSIYPPPPQQPPSNVSIYPPPPQQPPSNVSNNHPPPPQQQQPASSIPQPAQRYNPGYAVNGGRAQQEYDRLPCCGLGIGWFLFILGFFFGTIPWYIGFFCLLFSSDPREKSGYSACAIATLVATALIILGALRESHAWH